MKFPTFKSGIHPNDSKHFTQSLAIEKLPSPKEVFIPLQQHIGAPCKSLVEVGEMVTIGQVIGATEAYVSSPVHATINGKVKAIAKYQHTTGGRVEMIHIVAPEEDTPIVIHPKVDWESYSIEELREKIKKAGIVGLGGAAFPTHVKLNPPQEKPIDTLILNGCECEPYLTADHRMMLEYPKEILKGMAIIMKIL